MTESKPEPPTLPEHGEVDEALRAAVLEVEAHAADAGWDQPARLFALVETARLRDQEPELAVALGLGGEPDGSLTPVQQDEVDGDNLERLLETIGWPASVTGCAAVVERLVLPPSADGEVPAEFDDAQSFAREHPDRQEVRIVAGVTRAGARYCALRLRAHDDPLTVITGVDLVPALLDLLAATVAEPIDQEIQ